MTSSYLNGMHDVISIGLFEKKSTPPQQKACWKISREGGLTALVIQTEGGL